MYIYIKYITGAGELDGDLSEGAHNFISLWALKDHNPALVGRN